MRIPCPACQRPISFDENRLPLREVTFPCPACKAPVTFDRRSLTETAPPEPAPEPALPVLEEPAGVDEDHLGANRALLVGADSPALRQAARALGFQVTHAPAAEAARDLYLQDYPPLVLLSPAQLTRPPLAEMQPLTGMSPIDRRRGYFVLIADGLKTLDGTVAFLYDVNLVVAAKDLPSIQRIWSEAQAQHKKLYQAFEAAVEALR
jgi:endogenous inhibitor of DNA gyrase (YacG/DUF329 family)